MFTKVLLGLSAACLLAVAAAPPPASGRSLTENELWAVTGGAGLCCGEAPVCQSGGDPPAGGCIQQNVVGCLFQIWTEQKSGGADACIGGNSRSGTCSPDGGEKKCAVIKRCTIYFDDGEYYCNNANVIPVNVRTCTRTISNFCLFETEIPFPGYDL